jgi:hypothetical protein
LLQDFAAGDLFCHVVYRRVAVKMNRYHYT